MTEPTPNDKERIDAIPRAAAVLGIDSADRVHLFTHRPTEIWVVDRDGTECLHHVTTTKPLSEWVAFVAKRCGWDRRHRIEAPAFSGLFEDAPTPPTRAEVLA